MYSALGIHKNSRHKHPDELIGTHQELDIIARRLLGRQLKKSQYFPSRKEILYFEGMRGPDGLKSKSPDEDEPIHFIIPGSDDRHLIDLISDHQYNLRQALQANNHPRAAFEAAWLAHALTDGLTPAHHVPLTKIREDLMSDKELFRIFGTPLKGLIRGDSALKTLQANWQYWGVNGYMSRHIAFEYLIILILSATPPRKITPHLTAQDFANLDLISEFEKSLEKVASLRLYERFGNDGITPELIREIRTLLLPEIVKIITLGWYSCL